jgi:hypothetical protein
VPVFRAIAREVAERYPADEATHRPPGVIAVKARWLAATN